jgi:hypothetical protein
MTMSLSPESSISPVPDEEKIRKQKEPPKNKPTILFSL